MKSNDSRGAASHWAALRESIAAVPAVGPALCSQRRNPASTHCTVMVRLIGMRMQAIMNRINSKRWGKRNTCTIVLVIMSTRSPMELCIP